MLREADEEHQARDEQHAAAHAEQSRDHAPGEPDHDRAAHRTISSTALASSTPANSSAIARAWIRCCSQVPANTPAIAGTPTSAASSTCTLPYRPWAPAAKAAMNTIAASDVPVAARSS